jgi:CPA1 family monovalent cation:H+ antiporter
VISTAAVGAGIWEAARLIGHPITFAWALVFGALISPTDPVAVLSVLKNVNVPADLEVEMQGELLFNDGVGVVLFTVLLGFASGGGENTSAAAIVELLVLEAGGGLLLGLATGYIAYRGMRFIDDYPEPARRECRPPAHSMAQRFRSRAVEQCWNGCCRPQDRPIRHSFA